MRSEYFKVEADVWSTWHVRLRKHDGVGIERTRAQKHKNSIKKEG